MVVYLIALPCVQAWGQLEGALVTLGLGKVQLRPFKSGSVAKHIEVTHTSGAN